MDSEEPPNVRVACSGDIDEVVRLMHDAAAWMSAKGTPAWDVARIDRTFAETFVLRSELLVASCSDGIVGCCTLSAEDPDVTFRRRQHEISKVDRTVFSDVGVASENEIGRAHV